MENIRWHRQNLNEGGSGLWYGRAWLDVGKSFARLEWAIGKFARSCGVYIGIGSEDGITFHLGIPYLINIWFSLHLHFLNVPDEEYQTGVTLFDEFISVCIWRHAMESRNAWFVWTMNWKTFLLGKKSYANEVFESVRSHILLPEGAYPCTVRMSRSIWKRPRWKAIVRHYATFVLDEPIPIPGKGEDVWDIGDDAIRETSRRLVKGKTVSDLARDVAQDVIEIRNRYGGSDWSPKTS